MTAIQLTSSTQDVYTAVSFHEEERCRLTRVYNAHSRAATLPASVLALIFLEQATSFYERRLAFWYGAEGEYISEPSHKPIYSWVEVSYVCRSWRKAALHCPKLWTTIVLDERVKAEFIKLLLDRSQGFPLTVVMHAAREDCHCPGCSGEGDRGDRNYSDAVNMLGTMLPRTHRLSVFISKEEHSEVWKALQGLADASDLEYLRLEATDFLCYLPRSEYSSGRARVLVPTCISSTIPPKLSSLVIRGVGFGWSNQLLCSSLRRLNISLYKSDKGTYLEHLLAALRAMPSLESLDIDETPPAGMGGATGRAALPHLRNLRIPLESKNSAPFLLSLDVPSTTSVLLHAEKTGYSSSAQKKEIPEHVQTIIVAAIKDFLAKETIYAISYDCKTGYARWESPPRTSLWSIGQSDERGDDILSWQAVEQHPQPRLVCGASLDSPIMTKMFAALPLQSVCAVRIQEDTHRTLQELLKCLRGAENLTCLHLEGEVALAVGSALCGWTRPAHLDPKPSEVRMDNLPPPTWYGFGEFDDDCWDAATKEQGQDATSSPADATGSAPLPLLFPRLRALGISRVDFPVTGPDADRTAYKYKPRFWELYRGIPYGFDVKSIMKSMRLRSGVGASKVIRMDFVKCECIEKGRLLPLVDAVPEVMWDGRRITPRDLREAHSST